MDVLETLTNEHGLIRSYLDNISLAGERLVNGVRPPREFFENAVVFSRDVVDTLHHFKEEHVLFVRMAQKKSGEIDGALEMLRHQHERGRHLVGAIENAIDGYAKADPIKTGDLVENLSAFASLLRHHIHTEDHIFYPMARETLTAEDMALIKDEFEKDRLRVGERAFEEGHLLVVEMGSLLVHLDQHKQ